MFTLCMPSCTTSIAVLEFCCESCTESPAVREMSANAGLRGPAALALRESELKRHDDLNNSWTIMNTN